MKKNAIKAKKSLFICQLTENALKVVKCAPNGGKKEFSAIEVEVLTPDLDEKKLSENIARVFKGLEYAHQPVIISFPRAQATCRHIKVPTQSPQEIEKIILLQAPRYLPYPAEELITGYQVISSDKDGYANINLVIAHKDAIERYIRIFKELKPAKLDIVLSSYGLANFYQYAHPEEIDTAMIVDIDARQIEVAVVSQKKLVFSRAFKFTQSQTNWEGLFIDEINKTRDAYAREIAEKGLMKIMLTGSGKTYRDFTLALNKNADFSAEGLAYEKIGFSDEILRKVMAADCSFAGIIGLGLREAEESLNLLPAGIKEESKKLSRKKETLQQAAFIAGAILVLGLAIAKNLDNKALYLKQLKAELNKISKDALPLEEIEKRIAFIEQRSRKKLSGLDVLYELHKNMPSEVSLVALNYEENDRAILHGQTPDLSYVFELVEKLEKSPVFKNFNIKVRYATKKRVQAGEVIDFEIVCSRKSLRDNF